MVTDRLHQYIKHTGLSVSSVEKSIGASDGTLRKAFSNHTDIKSSWLVEVSEKFPNLSIEWLVSGKGDMIRTPNDYIHRELEHTTVNDSTVPYSLSGSVPYYDLSVSAGKSLEDMKGALKPDGYIRDLPGIENTDAILPVRGFSMEPEVKNNALIGVKKVEKLDHLNTEYKYLIVTSDDRMLKYIEHDETNKKILWCVSPNYKRFSILKKEVIEIHRVTFVFNPG